MAFRPLRLRAVCFRVVYFHNYKLFNYFAIFTIVFLGAGVVVVWHERAGAENGTGMGLTLSVYRLNSGDKYYLFTFISFPFISVLLLLLEKGLEIYFVNFLCCELIKKSYLLRYVLSTTPSSRNFFITFHFVWLL